MLVHNFGSEPEVPRADDTQGLGPDSATSQRGTPGHLRPINYNACLALCLAYVNHQWTGFTLWHTTWTLLYIPINSYKPSDINSDYVSLGLEILRFSLLVWFLFNMWVEYTQRVPSLFTIQGILLFSKPEFYLVADMCNLVSFKGPIFFFCLLYCFFQHDCECQSLVVTTQGKYGYKQKINGQIVSNLLHWI